MSTDAAEMARLRYAWRNNGGALIIIDELEEARAESDSWRRTAEEAQSEMNKARADRDALSAALTIANRACDTIAQQRDSAHALLRKMAPALEANVRARIAAVLGDKP